MNEPLQWTIRVRDTLGLSSALCYLVRDYDLRSAQARAILAYIDDSDHPRRTSESLTEFYKRYQVEVIP